MKRLSFLGLVSVLLTVLFIGLSSSTVFAKVYEWKMHAYVPEPVNLYQGYMLPFIKEIDKRSNGQIKITPYPVGAIVAPSELLVGTAEGVIEVAMGTTGYDTGIIPEGYAATNLPYGWENTSQPTDFWYNNKEAWDILDKAYMKKNVKLVALLNPEDPMTFLTMFPVNKISDFKGKLIRSSGNWAKMVSNAGASQVNMGLGEVYQALEKGVIDGVFMALSGLNDFKWNEIVKYVMMPPVMVGGGADVIVNLDAFNSLTPDLQKIFVETARDMDRDSMIPYTRDLTSRVVDEAKAKGVEFVTIPEEEVAIMRNAALGMWDKIDGINKNTARQMELMRGYLDSKGVKYPK